MAEEAEAPAPPPKEALEAPAEQAPEDAPEAVSEAAPEAVSEAAPEAVPEAAPEAVPEAAPQAEGPEKEQQQPAPVARELPTEAEQPSPVASGQADMTEWPTEDEMAEWAEKQEQQQAAPAGGSLQSFLVDSELVKAYASECNIAGRKVNPLVEICLLEAAEAKQETFYIEAPGNDKRVFTSRLGDEDMLVFSKVFYVVTPFLCRLDLSYNLLGDEGAKQLASLMGPGPRASALSSLQLRSNDIGPEGAEALCGALRNTRSLRRFDISMNPLGKEGGLLVVSLLQKSPELLELLMGDTKSDIDVLVALAAVLRRHPSQLKVLDVQNPRIFTLQEDHTVHLGKMLRNNTTITELYLGKQRMRDDGARQLVVENKVLRVLDLRCNELGAEAAYSLGTLLAHGSELVSLNLSCNRIGEKDNVEGARAIAEGLTHNSKLQHLDLNHNELCCQALSLLGDSLQKSNLDSLRLFHNHWDQPSSYLFHTILNSRMRRQQLKADFTTSEVDQHIHICKVEVK
eukprot:CAMPEP_0181517650 /NCGR_PEP_ID=MMETSP1110-20121109/64825_1 /TAXON_ID=174948 /ORGANISM="Symbiodinium sp., Strain CCMP421" /LENGTH=513 /DNA_ID=CAMNT_0023647957 /DNA_START=22 /DNA_END=1563 /DNA_ORIENTATION=-